jgi:hypothetical protein
MPIDSVETFMRREKKQYLKEMRVIEANNQILFEKKFNLKEYHLEKGNYTLQIGYYAGVGLEKAMVGRDQIDRDKIINGAELYQGCAISNEIHLRID